MIRRLALVSVLVVTGALTFTEKANAQSVDIDFNGEVPNSCTINKISDGVLSPIDRNVIDANNSRGQFLVNCLGSATVTISNPVGTTPTATNYAALLGTETLAELWDAPTGGTFLADSQGMFGGTSHDAVSNGTDVPLYVNIFTRNFSTPLPVGTYGFRTTVTVNPL